MHRALHSEIVSNLDLIQLFLDHGADPNAVNDQNESPLHQSLGAAAPAAKFVLEYCVKQRGRAAIDLDIVESRGMTVLAMTRGCIKEVSFKYANCSIPHIKEQLKANREQLLEFERVLVEHGARDSGTLHW